MNTWTTMMSAERRLNDTVANLSRNLVLRARSVFDPLPLTASEEWLIQRLREDLEAAKEDHRKALIYERDCV